MNEKVPIQNSEKTLQIMTNLNTEQETQELNINNAINNDLKVSSINAMNQYPYYISEQSNQQIMMGIPIDQNNILYSNKNKYPVVIDHNRIEFTQLQQRPIANPSFPISQPIEKPTKLFRNRKFIIFSGSFLFTLFIAGIIMAGIGVKKEDICPNGCVKKNCLSVAGNLPCECGGKFCGLANQSNIEYTSVGIVGIVFIIFSGIFICGLTFFICCSHCYYNTKI